MKRKNLIGYSLIAGMVAFSSIAPQVHAENQLDTAKQQLQQKKNQVDSIKGEMDTLRADIQAFDAKIKANQAELVKTNNDIATTKQEIEKKLVEIQKLNEKIVIRTDILKKRMSALQKEEKTNVVVDVLVNSKNVVDLFQRVSSLDMIFQSDTKIMDQLGVDHDAIERERNAVEEKKNALVTYEDTLKATKTELENNQTQKQQAFSSLENKLNTAVTEMEASQSQLKGLEEQALFLQSQDDNSSNGSANTAPIPPASGGVIGKAQQQLGKPYVFGAAGPNAFDCSGFISYVYGVGRTDVAGYWGRATKISSPEPGDLVFFQNTYKPGPSHVGIYVGNGQMIHAGDKGIAYSNLSSSYNRNHFLGYGRF